jgi:nucleoside-diphosphate-sugar epimerase
MEIAAPDYVFHLASRMTPGREINDAQQHIEDNILATANVCLAAPSNLKLLILFGSSDEYGGHEAPFDEQMTPSALSLYGWAKISAASLAKILCERRSIPYTWLRPSLFFGPGVSEKLFFGFVLNKCVRDEVVPLTHCEQTRDFLYIDDLARMMECLLAKTDVAQGRTWNISSGQPRQLRDVAELIQSLVGGGYLDFGAIPYRSNEIMNFYSSPRRFNNAFAPPPLTDFAEAVRETVRKSLGALSGLSS